MIYLLKEFFGKVDVKINIEFIIAILGIILAVISLIPKNSKKKKKLSIKQADNYPVVTIVDKLKGRVLVLFDGQISQEIYEIVIYLKNSGSEVLKNADFHKNCSIIFGKDVRIRENRLLAFDEFTKAKIISDNQNVELSIILMEPKTYLKIEILYESYLRVDTKFESNIIGGERIRSDLQLYSSIEHYVGASKDSVGWLPISFLLAGIVWVLEIFIIENSLGISVFDKNFEVNIPFGWFGLFFIIPLFITYKLFMALHFNRQPWFKINDWTDLK